VTKKKKTPAAKAEPQPAKAEEPVAEQPVLVGPDRERGPAHRMRAR
jgi:hypothetical protein